MKTFFNILIALVLLLNASETKATGILYTTNVLQPAQGIILHPTGMHAVANIHDQIVSTTVREKFIQNWTEYAQSSLWLSTFITFNSIVNALVD